MDYVVIGCSAAGLAAAKEIRRADNKAEITVVTEEADPFYFRSYLIDLVTGKVSNDQIGNRGDILMEQFEVEVQNDRRVISLDSVGNFIRFSDGEILYYDRLLIATGRRASYGLLNKFKEFVYQFHDLSSAQTLRDRLTNVSRAIVCGGGLYAVELSLALVNYGLDVTFISDEYHFWQSDIGEMDRISVQQQLASKKIKDKLVKDISKIVMKRDHSVTMTVDDGIDLDADLIISAYPTKPAVTFLRGSDVEIGEGIIVSQELRSSVSNIFAAGDVAEVVIESEEQHRMNYGWRSAARQGEIAGTNMVGKDKKRRDEDQSPYLMVPPNDAFFFDFVGGVPIKRWQ